MAILIPARNSRHRFACLALYRALLRSARGIQLPVAAPEDIRDPVRWLVRGQFRRNRRDVSPRLVYSALSAGYKVRPSGLGALWSRRVLANFSTLQ